MSIKHRLVYQILCISMTVILLLGCSKQSPQPSQMEKSPFTGVPCSAPCWQGLTVGESDESDVRSMLPTLTFINQDTINFHQMSMPSIDPKVYAPGVEIIATCMYPKQQCLTIKVVNDVLTEIDINLNYEITLEEAIGYLDNPDFIGYQISSVERISCELDIVWGNRQLVLASDVFYGADAYQENCGVVSETGKIMSNLAISQVRYLSTKSIEAMLSSDTNQFFEFSGTFSGK